MHRIGFHAMRTSTAILLAGWMLVAYAGHSLVGSTYSNDATTIQFRQSKAYVETMVGTTLVMAYETDGDDNVILHSPQGDMLLTSKGDGSLSGMPGGPLVLQASSADPTEGTYHDAATGQMSIRLQGGKAYMSVGEHHDVGSYTLRGNEVVITDSTGAAMAFTRGADGKLSDKQGNVLVKAAAH